MCRAKKILVIRGGAIGDFILTLPVLAALRKAFPAHGLEILGYKQIASLAVAAGLADRVSAIEAPELAEFFVRHGTLAKAAAEYFSEFELIISYLYDPKNIFQANVSRCTGAEFLAGPHRPAEMSQRHATQILLSPLERLGLNGMDPRPRLPLPGPVAPADAKWMAAHPGSGSPRKNWPEPKWAGLLARLAAETRWHFLLIGGEAEGSRCERLATALPAGRVRLAQNLPLVELAQALRSCSAFIGHDSGITHLAAALDLPGIVLWGPSNETVWRPLNDRMRIVRNDEALDSLLTEWSASGYSGH